MSITLSPQQEAHIAALAARSGRSPGDLVTEAVALWEARRGVHAQEDADRPSMAATRILELRRGAKLPPGESIKSMIEHGRG
ncbi:MAG: hypothetical protein ACR65X_03955 [Methylocystis sp.]|jgi:hypothetical protein